MYKTAESVTPEHPDKLCDRISDAILDECLRQDPLSRVAVETMGGHGIITVTGEVTTDAFFDARKIVDRIAPGNGVQINIVKQSQEIANGVDTGGAGDQGIMVGYACNENKAMIPQEQFLARDLCQFIWSATVVDGHQDGKTQITINSKHEIVTIVASFCNIKTETLKALCEAWSRQNLCSNVYEIHANPAGDWNIGGFEADTGVTGRKLIVDNYGPMVPIGGGAFSGKDSTKVDRSAAYKARQLAVRVLKERGCDRCIVQLAYAIGKREPVMATAVCLWDGEEKAESFNLSLSDELTPNQIIKDLGLREPIFEETAMWGHFGHQKFSWEN